jgi:hypothetical protein
MTLLGDHENGESRGIVAKGVAGATNMILEAIERQTAVALFVPVSVALGKGEIRQDVAQGHVPRDVASFADLHDHRDANEYGGLCNEEYLSAWGLSSATVMAVGNDIQNLLDEWIKGGGLQ